MVAGFTYWSLHPVVDKMVSFPSHVNVCLALLPSKYIQKHVTSYVFLPLSRCFLPNTAKCIVHNVIDIKVVRTHPKKTSYSIWSKLEINVLCS